MRGLLHLSPHAGRGRLASEALAKRRKSGEGAIPQAQTRGGAPSPAPGHFVPGVRSAALRSESDLSPHAGRGGASGLRVPKLIIRKSHDAATQIVGSDAVISFAASPV